MLYMAFLRQGLIANNIYDFGLIENDIKLQILLTEDKMFMKTLFNRNSTDEDLKEKLLNSCSPSPNKTHLLHPFDALCLIRKYARILPKIQKSFDLTETKVLKTISEETYDKAVGALGIVLNFFIPIIQNILFLYFSKYRVFQINCD